MDRREFFKWLPVAPIAMVRAEAEREEPREMHAGEVLTAEDWNRLVRAIKAR